MNIDEHKLCHHKRPVLWLYTCIYDSSNLGVPHNRKMPSFAAKRSPCRYGMGGKCAFGRLCKKCSSAILQSTPTPAPHQRQQRQHIHCNVDHTALSFFLSVTFLFALALALALGIGHWQWEWPCPWSVYSSTPMKTSRGFA